MEVKRFALSAAGAAAASGSGYALASMVTSTFDTDGIIVALETIVIETGLSGTLTGMDITVNFYDSGSSTVWASDLLIALDDGSNVAGIEWGGFNARGPFKTV